MRPNLNIMEPLPDRQPQGMIPASGSTVRPSFGGGADAQHAGYRRGAHSSPGAQMLAHVRKANKKRQAS